MFFFIFLIFVDVFWVEHLKINNKTLTIKFEVEFQVHPRFFVYHSKALDPLG